MPGGLLLFVDERDQIGGRALIQTAGCHPRAIRGKRAVRDLPGERANGFAQFGGPAQAVALPKRNLARLAKSGRNHHPVVGDLLDPPTGRAEGKHITHPRFVNHLFIELTDPPAAKLGFLGARRSARRPAARVSRVTAGRTAGRAILRGCRRADHEDPEESAVGNRAPGCHSQPLRPRPAGERSGHAIPDDARSQFRKLITRIQSTEQVERGNVGAAGEGGEGCTLAHRLKPFLDPDRFERDRGNRLLGKHVERVRGHRQRFDLATEHPFGSDRGVDEIGTMFRKQYPARNLADLMPGAAHPLQSTRHRRRRFDLHHQIDGAHVDAEFEGRGGNHTAQAPTLEIVFNVRALVFADRTVVGTGEEPGGRGGSSNGADGGT